MGHIEPLAAVVLAFALFVLVFFLGMLAYRWKLTRRTPVEIRKTDKRCVVCHCALPKGAMRDAWAKWTCDTHKGRA